MFANDRFRMAPPIALPTGRVLRPVFMILSRATLSLTTTTLPWLPDLEVTRCLLPSFCNKLFIAKYHKCSPRMGSFLCWPSSA